MAILNSLDELLYSVMSWLIFYPLTLWRTLRNPLQMMDYAHRELGDSEDQQYTDTVSPPLFLLISVLLAHGMELAFVGDSPLVRSTHGIDALISDDTSLILFRLFMFSIFSLIMATWMLRRRKTALAHDRLKQPFYSQCYVAAPFALLLSISATFAHFPGEWPALATVAIMVVAFAWYLTVQTRWFARELRIPAWRGFLNALFATGLAMVILALATPFLI